MTNNTTYLFSVRLKTDEPGKLKVVWVPNCSECKVSRPTHRADTGKKLMSGYVRLDLVKPVTVRFTRGPHLGSYDVFTFYTHYQNVRGFTYNDYLKLRSD